MDLSYYQQQHKLRLSYMPWLYWSLKEKHRVWAQAWQKEWQEYLISVETVDIEGDCFIAPQAQLFAEPGRAIKIGDGSFIAADCVIHGPVVLGRNVAINHHCTLDGGSKGITIGDESRLAAYCHLYAFNHLHEPNQAMYTQGTRSEGITIGRDVWLGAHVGVTDGTIIGDKVVVGMNSTVTKNIPAGHKIAGSPARVIGLRK